MSTTTKPVPTSPRLPARLYYGGDYNPEQWPEEVWREDVRLMREAGVNLVSVGIFSWAKIQPREGVFEFIWLDRVLDLLHSEGVGVCLATATASPPPWLTRAYPGVLPMDATGTVLFPGSRQHYSPSSPDYRRLAAELVRQIAQRYGRHPALVAWHINNEYACHLHECHNEASTLAFREWLKNRYGTLDALNEAWGTAFWSQLYHEWDEIFTPRKAPYHSNPSQQLDFRRFTSDAFLACYRLEAAILREVTPGVPITTNFMAFHRPLDHHQWAPEVDFTSWDSYPDPLDEAEGRHWAAIGHDLTRSLKPGRPWVLMEQASSAVNWRPVNRPKRPGLMRVHSLQAVARGADGVMFFQWRASRAGAEKFHSSLIPHQPPAQSRVFNEVRTLGQELRRLHPIAGSVPPPAPVAIVFDWENWWACDLESKPGRTDCVAWVR
ncbi:MAG TPA: beta-galactosidase, partial [Candidatus Synoicihabitans sp.]|nr:beta-galactosidase [Candidatus Synoicihabitans sp.]